MRSSFLSAEEFAGSMAAILPEVDIEHLPLRFGAVTLDLDSAEEVVVVRGDLRMAARASSAIPGILPPVRFNGRLLIDGGWVDKIPVLPAFKLGADVVIHYLRKKSAAAAVVAEISELGRRAVAIKANLAEADIAPGHRICSNHYKK